MQDFKVVSPNRGFDTDEFSSYFPLPRNYVRYAVSLIYTSNINKLNNLHEIGWQKSDFFL